MKKLICILSCLLLIASTVIVSSAASETSVNVLNATDYFKDKSYDGDNVTVEYDFPLKPYADVFGWNAHTNTKIYLGGASGNPLKYSQGASFNDVFNSVQYYISPLGYSYSNGSSLANVIDLTGVKSGSDFLVHFSFDIYIKETSLFNYDNMVYYFHIVDSNLNEVQSYRIPLDINLFTLVGDFSTSGNTYRYDGQLRFKVPESGLYVYPEFDTDFLDFTLNDSAAQISFEFNYFKLFIDKSAFEDNSVAMQQIQDSIDSGFADVNENLDDVNNKLDDANDKLDDANDKLDDVNNKLDDANNKLDDVNQNLDQVEDLLTSDPNHVPDTSPLKEDLNELEDLEGEINEEINKPIELPDGSELEVGGSTLINLKDWWKDYFDAPEYEATAGKLYAKIFESFMPFLGTPIFFSLLLGLIIAFLTGKRFN